MSLGILCLVSQNNDGKHIKYVLFWRDEIALQVVEVLVNIHKTLLKRVFKLFLIGLRFFTRTATTR